MEICRGKRVPGKKTPSKKGRFDTEKPKADSVCG